MSLSHHAPSVTSEDWTWQFARDLPSDLVVGRKVIELVVHKLAANHWTAGDVFGVQLALEEALSNAIRHGNGSDVRKRVRFDCRLSPARFFAQIEDEGPGFDPDALADPTHDDNLDLPSGRGILLMRNFMTRLEFNEAGNLVVMERVRGAAEDESPAPLP